MDNGFSLDTRVGGGIDHQGGANMNISPKSYII
jgi:hypothetical protein